ncbi:trans-sulfuration enzyme family protein [Falsibacillus albus]|uniref:homocysteine desulfhydrase n=1 Tax=Falsibacillus albus TaxID=2478915 RepID=A0A3L7K319_9BACI|nr:aminotransferase class I/II-fold pyridoxal phosphate-dependent enzyme [Falsibacillus albus]RLQ96749.1 aminotransferase class I/II-fold pyridoxal phosphate-dependent enzyme [Falsibacillus albus]
MDFFTKSVHSSLKSREAIKSKSTPIYQTSVFSFDSLEELEGFYDGDSSYLYTRTGNPNTDELGMAVAKLEEAPAGVASSSGLSAILAGFLSVVKSGDHIVAADDVYGGTFHILNHELKELGIETTFVSFEHEEEIRSAIKENTKLLFSESISNPFLRVENIQALVKIGQEKGIKTMIDNTFATPLLLQPYKEGVNLVVHSATKYLGGHSDVSSGVLTGDEDLVQKARGKIVNLGSNLSPFEAWLTCRGIKTLALRMERQSHNAERLASALKEHRGIQTVYYPEAVSPKGKGAVVTVELSGSADHHRFFKSLGWVKIVPSLAGVETTVSYPLGTSHRALSPEALEKLGINERVVRISVGIEDSEDIIHQFETALEQSMS